MRRTIIYNKNNFTIFFFKLFIVFLYQFIKKETAHPTFHLRSITQGRLLTFLKDLGFADLPITNIGNVSPAALAVAIPVNRIYCVYRHYISCLSCARFSWEVIDKKGQIHLPLYVPQLVSRQNYIGRDVSFHAFAISGVTDLDSPDTSLNEILYRVFQACKQPSDVWNFSIFNCFAKPKAFSRKIVPLIGMFSDLCISNHL